MLQRRSCNSNSISASTRGVLGSNVSPVSPLDYPIISSLLRDIFTMFILFVQSTIIPIIQNHTGSVHLHLSIMCSRVSTPLYFGQLGLMGIPRRAMFSLMSKAFVTRRHMNFFTLGIVFVAHISFQIVPSICCTSLVFGRFFSVVCGSLMGFVELCPSFPSIDIFSSLSSSISWFGGRMLYSDLLP